MKRLFIVPVLLLGIVFAAEVLRFEPALGTVSQYRISQKTVAKVLQSSVKTSDNSPVPAAFANLPNTLATTLNTEQTQNLTEKVVGVLPDGTRQLENIVSSNNNGQKIGYTVFSSLSPVGVAAVQKAEWDEATKKLLQDAPFELPLEFFTLIPPIYGKPLEVGSSFVVLVPNTSILAAFQAIAKAAGGTATADGLETTITYTYRGRNNAGEHVFSLKSLTSAGKIALQSSFFTLEQTNSSSLLEGTLVYLPDGRSQSSRTSTTQRFLQTQTINLGQSTNLVVVVEAELTTESTTELMP